MTKRSIEDFKAVLQGGGVRPTMFQVELEFPAGVITDGGDSTRDAQFLIKAAGLPSSNIGQIAIPFRGRQLKVSGDRVFEDWSVTIINDVSFGIRSTMEEWSERIQNHNYVVGSTNLADYFSSAIVRQLDRDGEQLRAYRFDGIWPKTISQIDLDFESTDTIEQYEVVFAVQYWSATNVGDPEVNNVPRIAGSNAGSIAT